MSKTVDNDWRVGCLWWLCRLLAVMPYWFQYYVVLEWIYVVLRFVLRYRRRLILRQLAESFPEKSEEERRRICNDYYHTLSEMIVNIVTLAGMSAEEQARRLSVASSEEVAAEIGDRNSVMLASHHGCWEYASFVARLFTNFHIVVAYHPLTNKLMDKLLICMRTHDRITPVASKAFMRFYVENRNGIDGKNLMLGLIADQNSPPRKDHHWFSFLNHPTLFFEGGEALALKYHLPVYYVELDRVRRGYYHCSFTKIYDGEAEVAPHEITERYVRLLEQSISRRPELWMWSHRRWKIVPDPETGRPRWVG